MYCRYRVVLLLPCHLVFSVPSLKVCHNAGFIMGVFYLTKYRSINLLLLHSHIFTLDSFVPSDWFIFSNFFHFSFFSYVFISSPLFLIFPSYGLDSPGIQSRWWRDFPHLSRPTLRFTQPPFKWVTSLFAGGKADGGVALTTHPHQAARSKKDYNYTFVLSLWTFKDSSRLNFSLLYLDIPFLQYYFSPLLRGLTAK